MIGGWDIIGPWREMPWGQWAFWRDPVVQARHLAFWFFPLVPLAAWGARRNVHVAWTLFSLGFSACAFGPVFTAYLVFLLMIMYRLGDVLSRECKRTDIHPHGPLIVALAAVIGAFFAYSAIRRIGLGPGALAWAREQAAWLLPMGMQTRERGLMESILITPHFCGIAFLTLKLIHFFTEIRRGTIQDGDRSFWRFVSYCTFAPSFLQGPIDRYPDYVKRIEHARETWRPADVVVGLWRIGVGILKKLIAIGYLQGWASDHPGFLRAPMDGLPFKEFYYRHPDQLAYGYLWLGIWAMTFEIYLEFSGYCDIAVGMARMTGYRMTEAFRLPWLSASLLEFWRRWNITVGLWLRDYVYIPLGGSRSHVYRNYVLTFVVCGVWHVFNGSMAIWGATLGGALAINRLWRELWSSERVPSWIGRPVRRLWPLWRVMGIIVTANTFCLLLLVFFKDLRGGGRVLVEMVVRPLKALFS